MLAGEPEEALEILTESYEHVERMGGFPLESAWLAQSLYAVGRFDEAERRAQAAVDAVDDDFGTVRGAWVRSHGCGRSRDVCEEAERMAREAVAYFEGTDYSIDRTVRPDGSGRGPPSGRTSRRGDRHASARRSVSSSSGRTSSRRPTRGS